MTPSPHDTRLQALKSRHDKLSKKLVQLEAVQHAVMDTYMLELQDERIRLQLNARRQPSRFIERVEKRLDNRAEIALFRNVRDVLDDLGNAPGGNFPDEMAPLSETYGSDMNEANSLCAQIHAIEENAADGLPLGPVPDPDELAKFVPIVAAVGWGELIVARESLVGYEAREIAHIENILPGETKLREHQRLSKTEEVQETEIITEKETEKDSQTTDRYELQAESQETINRNFSISTGVNTSGKYGLTDVDTSLDAAFSQSASQSRSSSINTAQEIVTKAVERTFERVRSLRRLTITEQIRELNRHELKNAQLRGEATPTAVSGMYLWVEKIQEVELRHYGTRMMIEFHVPEPAVSLLERAVGNVRKELPPFDVSPSEIQGGNFMCLAQRYGAMDVEPPPSGWIVVGYGWVSAVNEEAEAWAEDQFASMINIPEGYRPTWANVAWSGLVGKTLLPNGNFEVENREFNFTFSVGGEGDDQEHTEATNNLKGVDLLLNGNADWPQGVPVSGRVHGSWDGAMYVQVTVTCMRTTDALLAWQLRTWQALRVGYEELERKAAQDEQQQAYQRNLLGPVITERPAAENRRIERGELQKWAIKSMRRDPQNFNAIEEIESDGFQEMSPVFAEAQAPIVRFYEDSFEWEHMNYFLYPYHWARRASWRMRNAAEAIDPQHQAFLEAGAARVIVPVTPGFEDKVAWFLDPLNAEVKELKRILTPPPTANPDAMGDPFHDLWVELLTELKPDVARGSGTLKVTNGDEKVKINQQPNPDSQWRVSEQRDLGRELYIGGDRYEVAAVADATNFSLNLPYEGDSDASAVYVAGSTPFGPPWTVNVPTTLVVLADNVPALEDL